MSKIAKIISELSQNIIVWGITALLVLMPFHAFFSIYLGSLGFGQALIQSWKEALIIGLAFCWLLFCMSRRRICFRFDSTNIFFIAIILLSVLVTLYVHPNSEAVLFGIKTNLVAIAVFFIAQIPIDDKSFIKRNLSWIVIIPGSVVALIAILQSTILPESLLQRLGYNATNINPKQIVDGSIAFHRAFSTLGGPNQLGTYLIVPLAFSLIYAFRKKKWWLLLISILIIIGIGLSYSRSAWIGAIVAIISGLLLLLEHKKRLWLLGILAIIVVAGIITVPFLLKNNPRLENVIFHGRVFENRIEGSDQPRLEAITNTTQAIIAQPFGHGLGSAGPASYRAEKPIIPENWYLQIAYEIGIIGLILYLLAFAGLLGDFIRNRNSALAVSLFALTCGILTASLFLQSWTDSTLVLVVFALYGLYKGKAK